MPATTRRLCVLAAATVILYSAVALARDNPPAVEPPKAFHPPPTYVVKLPNGLSVVVVERRALPLLTLHFVVKSGAEADPSQLPGTAQLTAQVLTQGTASGTSREISDAVDAMGAQLSSGANWDLSNVELTVLSDHTEQAFELLSEIVRQPAFPPEEVERKRQQTISALDLLRDDPAYMADALFNILAFRGTPYGHPLDGTVESVRRLGREDLRQFHGRYYQPDNCILALVGDIGQDEALAGAKRFFGAWKGTALPESPPPVASETPPHRRIVVVDKPDAVQTEIRAGNPAIRRGSSEFYSLTVANQVLGGPAVNRIFRQLRSRRGLAYGASSELSLQHTAGSWMGKTSTRTAETAKSLRAIVEEMERLRSDRVGSQELRMAKSYLIGHMALEFETSGDIAAQTLELMVHRLPIGYWGDYADKVDAVDPSEVSIVSEKYLGAESRIIVLVGDASRFAKELREFGSIELIALRDLDLGSLDLRKSRP